MASLQELKTLLETIVNSTSVSNAHPIAHKWFMNIKTEFFYVLTACYEFFKYDDIYEKDIKLVIHCVKYESPDNPLDATGEKSVATRKTWIYFTIKNRHVIHIEALEPLTGLSRKLDYCDLSNFIKRNFTTVHMSGLIYKDLVQHQ